MNFGRTVVVGTALAVSLSASYAQWTRILTLDNQGFIPPTEPSCSRHRLCVYPSKRLCRYLGKPACQCFPAKRSCASFSLYARCLR